MRSMPLFAPVKAVLEGQHGPVVKAVNAEQMTMSAFTSMWRSYKLHMGIMYNGGLRPRWDKDKKFVKMTIRTHDFRHSFCTMICDAGVDIKTAMLWMGHSDEKMIRQIYDHVTAKRLQIAEQNTAKTIEKMLSNSQIDSQKKGEALEIVEI
jgi:integrase